jgi:hypothetical protein
MTALLRIPVAFAAALVPLRVVLPVAIMIVYGGVYKDEASGTRKAGHDGRNQPVDRFSVPTKGPPSAAV